MNKETTIFFHYIEYGLFKEFVIEVDLLIEMKRSVHGVPVLLPVVKNLYFPKVFDCFRALVSMINRHGDVIIISISFSNYTWRRHLFLRRSLFVNKLLDFIAPVLNHFFVLNHQIKRPSPAYNR